MSDKTQAKTEIRLRIVRILSRLGLFPNALSLLAISHPHKLLEFQWIARLASVKAEDVILDIGCGNGLQTMMIGKTSRFTIGADISATALSAARRVSSASGKHDNIEFVKCDALELPFRKDQFDKIVSFCVLEHIQKWPDALRAILGLLTPGGVLVISVDSLGPIYDVDVKEKHRKDHSVETYFSLHTLASALTRAGYSDIEVVPILKSRYAERLFRRGIIDGRFSHTNPFIKLVQYALLVSGERKARERRDGILIVAIARKPY